MSIISVSGRSECKCEEVAALVAQRLGYECLARDAIVAAAIEFGVSEPELLASVEEPPGVFLKRAASRKRQLAFVRAMLLKQLCSDDIVYHGRAGHIFLQGIGHALKVRVIAEMDERAASKVAREGGTEGDARHALEREDEARRKWNERLYGLDAEDPALYDAVAHIGKVGTTGAADMICSLLADPARQTTPESQADLEDLALAATVEADLVDMHPEHHDAEVTAHRGAVRVMLRSMPRLRGGSSHEFRHHFSDELGRRLHQRRIGFFGLTSVRVEVEGLR